jgi:hypothetical protein
LDVVQIADDDENRKNLNNTNVKSTRRTQKSLDYTFGMNTQAKKDVQQSQDSIQVENSKLSKDDNTEDLGMMRSLIEIQQRREEYSKFENDGGEC